ncbi:MULTISPECIES: response regulator transcription factor [Paraburkholderia]|uniref:DNA-binding response OmpR family regulator n=2 Tax=Paraburkholderia TaxID=1822464 RepID=A0A7Z0B425_9BURK|nr:response regulator transcription factor [Paraburkholderia bryophila]NYH19265.1 DNA-binding response OmpR family regulator [Paraburkholderia bryophila]NYH21778.1 DNA-binding response OmpR family regulator [Paraburkholderia bryophila]
MWNILIIEDDQCVAQKIARTLNAGGISVDVTDSGRKGIRRLMSTDYDAVILSRTPPDLDGLSVLATLRGIGAQSPILMVSSVADVHERIEGLRAGADDYMSMPFSFDEMLARIEVLLRTRPSLKKEAQPMLRVDSLRLDLVKRTLMFQQDKLCLQPTEFRLLEFMMRHAGQVLTRSMIFEAVWDRHFDPDTNLIDVHVARLRKKVGELGAQQMIRTVRGSGYRFG